MESKTLIKEHDRIIKLENIDLMIEIEDIRNLVSSLLLQSAISKASYTKRKYKKMALAIAELINYDNGVIEDRGKTIDIFHMVPKLPIDYVMIGGFSYQNEVEDDSEDNSYALDAEGVAHSKGEFFFTESQLYYEFLNEYAVYTPIQFVQDQNGSLIPIPTVDEDTVNQERVNQQMGEIFTIAESDYDLNKLSDAYQSNLWLDEESTWENHIMKRELKFLQKIDRNFLLNIHFFGEKISLLLLKDIIEKFEEKNQFDIQKLTNLFLETPGISIKNRKIESTILALESFIINESENGVDTFSLEVEGITAPSISVNMSDPKTKNTNQILLRTKALFQLLDMIQGEKYSVVGASYINKVN